MNMNFFAISGFIHLLPRFHGFIGEDPHNHLKEFHCVCSSMKPQGVSEEHVKLKAFPFSLQGIAKDWLYHLPPCSITSWYDLKKKFLSQFYPAFNEYNLSWENHLNLGWDNIPQPPQLFVPITSSPISEQPTLEELLRQMVENNLNFQQKTEANIETLENQISQLASFPTHMKSQSFDELPAQMVTKLEEFSATTMESGEIFNVPEKQVFIEDVDVATIAENPKQLVLENECRNSKNTPHILSPTSALEVKSMDVFEGTLSMEDVDHSIYNSVEDSSSLSISVHSIESIHPHASMTHTASSDLTSSHTCTNLVDDNLAEFLDDVDFASLANYSDSYTCNECTDSHMCSACVEIETYLQSDYDVGIAGSEELDCDAVVPSIESKCTDSIATITHTYDYVEVHAEKLVFASTRLLFSIVQPPTFELKPLPEHLEYAHLEDGFHVGLRQALTQITVPQDYELPLSAKNPPNPD